jgi:hypothetical protein
MLEGNCWAITSDELADKCQSAESAIRDVSLEYEWHIIPPWTLEELSRSAQMTNVGIFKDGVIEFKFKASRFLGSNDTNSVYSPYRWRVLSEESATIIAEGGKTWDNFRKQAFDGRIYKQLDVGGWPTPAQSGFISVKENSQGELLLTPIGFSIFHLELGPEGVLLSTCLRRKDMVHMGSSTEKVNDFNTICIDLLQEYSKLLCIRMYFSINHNYTPVKYEYFNAGPAGIKVAYTVEVQSLACVGDGLWFPTSGIIRHPDEERIDAFQATGKIVVNQGLRKEDFNIEFPPGTRISDNISGREYTVAAESK